MSQANNSPSKSGAEMMRELRLKMLTTSAADLKTQPSPEYPRVFSILMDWPLGTNTITVFSSCFGDASIYTTSTFGVMGGIGHETVRAAAKEFVKMGGSHYEDGLPAKEFPYPKNGHVYFYLVCFDGVRMIDRDEQLVNTTGRDKCSDLFNQGQKVITELRLVTAKKIAEK